jgi:hypothetical protein
MLFMAFSLVVITPLFAAENPLPQSIGPLRLEQVQSGETAKREVDRLHGKSIAFQKGYIGTYGNGEEAGKLWVSEYDSQDKAAEALEKMAQGVRASGEGGFWHFQEIPIEGIPVYFVVGMGQAHYFFQKGVKVIWLAVDPPVAKPAIRDVIGKIPESP